MRVDLLRLHVLEPRLFEVFPDLLPGVPFRARDEGRFEGRVHFLAGFGPRGRDAGMDGVDPGGDADDAAGGDDAVEFSDAGGGVVGEVNVCAGEPVRDARRGDVLV